MSTDARGRTLTIPAHNGAATAFGGNSLAGRVREWRGRRYPLAVHPKFAIALAVFFLTACATQTPRTDPERRLAELGITLPAPGAPVANYVNAVRSGNLVFLAGKGPKRADGTNVTGKVGRDLSIEEGYAAARLTGIQQLAALKAEIGDLRRVRRIVKVLGLVNCEATFTDQPRVINGFSDLMVEVFGEAGKHARSAVGAPALPGDIAVEVEMIVEIR